MNDLRKTKAQLIDELTALRQRVIDLEARSADADTQLDQARHRLVVELMSDYVYSGIAYPDCSARTEWVSGAFEGILGYTLADIQSLPGGFGALIVPEDLAAFAAQQPQLFAGETLTVEYRVRHRSGEIRWLRDRMKPIETVGHPPGVRLIGAVQDITARKHMEAALRDSEERFRTVADFTHDWEYWMGPDRQIVYMSPSCEQITGYRVEEFQAQAALLDTIVYADDRALIQRHLTHEFDSEAVGTLDFRIVTRQGEVRWINHICQPVYDSAGRWLGRRASNRDITERTLAEAAVRASEECLRTFFQHSPIGLAIVDRDFRFLAINETLAAFNDLPATAHLGQSLAALKPPVAQVLEPLFKQILATGQPILNVPTIKHTDQGQPDRYFVSTYFPILDAQGAISALGMTVADVTDQRQIEEQLARSEAKFRAFIEQSSEGVIITDEQGRIIEWNRTVEQLSGLSRAAVMGQLLWDIQARLAPTIGAAVTAVEPLKGLVLAALQTGQAALFGRAFEADIQTPAGERKSILQISFPIQTDAGYRIGAVVRDITDYKQANAALHASEAKYRLLVDTANEGIWAMDRAHRTTYVNTAMAAMLGYSPGEMLGRPVEDFFFEEDMPIHSQRMQQRHAGQDEVYERRFQRRDGSALWTLVSARAIMNAAGEFDGSFAMFTDITDRKRAEAEIHQLNAELEMRVVTRTHELAAANQSLAAVVDRLQDLDRLKSKFVSDVSHELRTPVTSLSLYIDLLEHGKPEKRDLYVSKLKEQMARLHKLINDILDMSRLERDRDEGGRSLVDLNAIAEHVSAMERGAAEAAGLTLACEVTDHLPPVVARPDQLTRAITNLVANAIKYTPTGGVRVQTRRDTQRVCLEVTDTGRGIPADELPHVFERFYRGRAVAQSAIPGTGLGLSIVKEIIESHGGMVEVRSQMGQGSTFRVWLPVAEDDPLRSEA